MNSGFVIAQFHLLDPGLHIQYGSGSRRRIECGSTQIRIRNAGIWIHHI